MASNRQTEIAELRLLDSEMAARGITVDEFAAKMGICRNVAQRYRRYGFPSDYLRARAEAAVGYLPIFNPASHVEVRRKCQEALSFDPALLTLRELRKRCRALGISGAENLTLAKLIPVVIAHFAVNSPTKL